MTVPTNVAVGPDPGDGALDPAVRTVGELAEQLVASLPLVAVALAVAAVGLALASLLTRVVQRALGRTAADPVAVRMVGRLVRTLAVLSVVLLALSVAGVPVGPALAGIGLVGLAVAFALQSILENVFAGLVLLARRPFRAGEQIRTNDHVGTVADVDLRVTRLIDLDGQVVLVPNIDVYNSPLVNLSRTGKRRTRVTIGVDYRDDHDQARAVLERAVAAVDGVLAEPPPHVLLCELGNSSVDFELAFWTAAEEDTVRRARDRVLERPSAPWRRLA